MHSSDAVFVISSTGLLIETPYRMQQHEADAQQRQVPDRQVPAGPRLDHPPDLERRRDGHRQAGERGPDREDVAGRHSPFALRPELRLVGPLGGLVLRERLGRVDVPQRRVPGRHLVPARRPDPEPLAEQRHDRACLHLADAGQRDQPRVQVAGVLRAGPHAARVAAVAVRDHPAQVPDPLRHVAGEAVQGRHASGMPRRGPRDPWSRSSPHRACRCAAGARAARRRPSGR